MIEISSCGLCTPAVHTLAVSNSHLVSASFCTLYFIYKNVTDCENGYVLSGTRASVAVNKKMTNSIVAQRNRHGGPPRYCISGENSVQMHTFGRNQCRFLYVLYLC